MLITAADTQLYETDIQGVLERNVYGDTGAACAARALPRLDDGIPHSHEEAAADGGFLNGQSRPRHRRLLWVLSMCMSAPEYHGD